MAMTSTPHTARTRTMALTFSSTSLTPHRHLLPAAAKTGKTKLNMHQQPLHTERLPLIHALLKKAPVCRMVKRSSSISLRSLS